LPLSRVEIRCGNEDDELDDDAMPHISSNERPRGRDSTEASGLFALDGLGVIAASPGRFATLGEDGKGRTTPTPTAGCWIRTKCHPRVALYCSLRIATISGWEPPDPVPGAARVRCAEYRHGFRPNTDAGKSSTGVGTDVGISSIARNLMQ